MGFDVVGVVNSIWYSQYGVLAVLTVLLLLALWSSGFYGRLLRIIEEVMFTNWQLALLGSTAIALSLASGYTTFDGLRNFTSAPLLWIMRRMILMAASCPSNKAAAVTMRTWFLGL